MKSNFLVSAITLLSLSLYPLQFVYAGNYTFNSIVISRTTITTISGLSTTILSNPEWTGNTAITSTITEKGSLVTTTLPVLYSCSLCGGKDHGLVFWGLPAETGGSEVIYRFPGLPTFTIGPSGKPQPVRTSSTSRPSSSEYIMNSIPSATGSISSSMTTSMLLSVPVASDLTRVSSLASSSSLMLSASLQNPSNRQLMSESRQDTTSIPSNQSLNHTMLLATTSFAKPSNGSLSVGTQRQNNSMLSSEDRTATSPSLPIAPYYNMTVDFPNKSDVASRCGSCHIKWSNADLFYWPDAKANDSCISLTSAQAIPSSFPGIPIVDTSELIEWYGVPASVTSLQASRGSHGTVVGPDGFTYVSPSAYVVFHNIIATDGCSTRGSNHDSITLAFAPGELSTAIQLHGGAIPTMQFDFANLPCPPESVMESYQFDWGSSKTYGPVLALPQKLLDSSKDFTGCVNKHPIAVRIFNYPAVFDIKVSSLDPATTRNPAPADVIASQPSQTHPSSASLSLTKLFPFISQHAKQQTTTGPQVMQTTETRPQQAVNQSPPSQDPASPASDTSARSPPAQDSAAQISPIENHPAQGPHQSTQSITAQNGNLPAQLPSTRVNSVVSTSVAWVQVVVVQSQTIVQGAPAVLISGATVKYSAGSIYVGNNAAPIPTATQPQPPPQKGPNATVIGGLSFMPVQQDATDPPAVVVSGQILTNNGPAATINGQLVAYSSDSIHVGTSVAAAPTAASQQEQQGHVAPSNAIIGGLTFIPVRKGSHAATGKPEVIVQGQTLKEDSSAITIDGNPVAYSSGSIYVGTDAAPAPTLPSNQNPENPPQVLEGFTFTPLLLPDSQSSAAPVAIGGQTVSLGTYGARIGTNSILPGAAPITISGTPVSLGSGGLVIGSQTYATSEWSTKYEAGSNLATVAGQAISIAPTGAVMLGSTTLTLGGSPITISGTPISLGVAGLVVGSNTVSLSSTPIQSIFNIGGTTFTANLPGFLVAGTPISRGGPAVTIAGTLVLLGPSVLVIGTSTVLLPSAPVQSVFTVDGTPFTANPTGFSVAETSISKGGPAVTIAGTLVSLGPSALIIGSSTVPFAIPPFQSVFTVAGTPFTANPTAFPIAGTTLIANGPAITISGTAVSLGPSGLVIGTSTIALNGPAPATTAGLGGLILQGLGPVGSSTTLSTTLTSTSTSTMTSDLFAGSAIPTTRAPGWALSVWGITAACMLCAALIL